MGLSLIKSVATLRAAAKMCRAQEFRAAAQWQSHYVYWPYWAASRPRRNRIGANTDLSLSRSRKFLSFAAAFSHHCDRDAYAALDLVPVTGGRSDFRCSCQCWSSVASRNTCVPRPAHVSSDSLHGSDPQSAVILSRSAAGTEFQNFLNDGLCVAYQP